MKFLLILFLSFFFSTLSARSRNLDPGNAWWTGSLLSSSAVVVSPMHYNIEPYLFVNNSYGIYDSQWDFEKTTSFVSINPLVNITFGLIKNIDMQVLPQAMINSTSGKNDTHLGDIPVRCGYQLLKEEKNSWIPYVRLVLSEVFPTGKFQHLEPQRLGADISGLGSFRTSIALDFQKLIVFEDRHPLRLRANFSYDFLAPVKVSGFNTYGGGFDTEGKVFPGNIFFALFALEYGITRNWVLALDCVYEHSNKDRFIGRPGFLIDSIEAQVGLPSSENFSLAPAFEYNYDEHVGFIAGVWFTVMGRNSLAFFSPVLALNFYY